MFPSSGQPCGSYARSPGVDPTPFQAHFRRPVTAIEDEASHQSTVPRCQQDARQ